VVRDIRTLYAALGLLLVALRNITPRTAVITAGCALLALAAVQLLATSGGDDAGLSFLDVQALAFAAVIWLVRDRLRWSCSCSAWRRETPPAGGRASPGPVAPAHPVEWLPGGHPDRCLVSPAAGVRRRADALHQRHRRQRPTPQQRKPAAGER
jgi:hypothetical protein